ncbi:selenocysteine-specific translation elongation factor [Parafannyhessea umbonata]|uniref:Selenocysteine-specific elongation factor n=1 Tax=Parafannyhessea umbonata TaxID=604330 RepID=A0A1H1MHY9_9ACTN|nr:selenocysteine-specific translation elongation factor [Parafannyhessea umbonata]SDR86277.1 selenocysteine-specific elongation factor [Parafannyhessea umbonata]
MKHVVIGTAGHVDHGKTWLTRALTGTNTDRLKEERERSITVDIGFAQLTLPNGQRASIIDVPGHEALVKNMIAGATGIDVVLLVVASDEGFMPQTQEHLDILGLLGVERGIIVMTKCDAVGADWADMVEADILDHVEGTFLQDAPVVRVSAVTGEGIDLLKQRIADLVEQVRPRNEDRACRLPVDRAFTIKGFGTVVTGTLVDGTVSVGDEVEVYPQRKLTRIRSLQNHNEAAESMSAGMRVAANLQGVERKEVSRGCIVAKPGTLRQADRLLTHVVVSGDSPFDVRNSSRVHFYTGTGELMCRVRLLDADALPPGEDGFAQLVFDRPVTARNHDRFIIRFFSPVVTIGGGTILDIAPGRARRNSEPVLRRLRALNGSREERLLQRVRDAGVRCATAPELEVAENLSPKECATSLSALCGRGLVQAAGDAYVAADVLGRLEDDARAVLAEYHEQHALERGMGLGALRTRLFSSSPERADALVGLLEARGRLVVDGRLARLPDFEATLSPEQLRLHDSVVAAVEEAGFEPLETDELVARVGGGEPALAPVLDRMRADGEIVSLTPTTMASAKVWRRGLDTFMQMAASGEPVTIAQFRDRIGASRKFAGLFLDSYDRAGYTRLVGDARVVLRRPQD